MRIIHELRAQIGNSGGNTLRNLWRPKRVPDHTSTWEATMFDSVASTESEPIGGVSSGWLWAPRCFALICILIAVGEAFHESTRLGAAFHLADGGIYFAG